MTKLETLAALIEAQDHYIEILTEEIRSLAPSGHARGWKSRLSDAGDAARARITDLRAALARGGNCL